MPAGRHPCAFPDATARSGEAALPLCAAHTTRNAPQPRACTPQPTTSRKRGHVHTQAHAHTYPHVHTQPAFPTALTAWTTHCPNDSYGCSGGASAQPAAPHHRRAGRRRRRRSARALPRARTGSQLQHAGLLAAEAAASELPQPPRSQPPPHSLPPCCRPPYGAASGVTSATHHDCAS